MEKANEGREGFLGWMGMGGSVFQWHPDLGIGIGYVPTLLEWFDLDNVKAANLQRQIVKCVKAIKGIAADVERPLSTFQSLAPHRFEEKSYRQPTFCDYCGKLLIGIMKQGMQCKGCKINIHFKCKELMNNSCYDSELANITEHIGVVEVTSASVEGMPPVDVS